MTEQTTRHEVVPPVLRRVLQRLTDVCLPHEFYLGGGTGLALLLSHRRSVDLDFFSRSNRLEREERPALLARLQHVPRWTILEEKDGTVHGQVGQVRVSFLWYAAPLVRPLMQQGKVRIASLEDIGLMKLGAIIGRGARKDFVDLYAICQQVSLADLLALSRKKFTTVRDFTLQALKALSYFEDAEHDPPVVTPEPIHWDHIKTYFTREVHTLTQQYLGT